MRSDPLRWHRRMAVFIGLTMALSLVVLMTTASAADKLADLSSVLGELRMGGFVIYFRHGATDQTGPSDEAADLAKCETQRNLSADGREQAIQIGKAFRRLGVPVGAVTVSPFCRTKDTARLAFGRFTANNDLSPATGTSATEAKRLADAMRQMLSTPPAQATNAVIVSHSSILREASGIWPKPEGVAYVFRPLPNGQFEAVAKVLPEDWVKAARLMPSREHRTP